jgi:hypothetical protein
VEEAMRQIHLREPRSFTTIDTLVELQQDRSRPLIARVRGLFFWAAQQPSPWS